MIARTLLGGLIPFITSPVGLAAVGVGALGYTLYSIFTDKEEEQGDESEVVPNESEPFHEPFHDGYPTAPNTVDLPLETADVAVNDTVSSVVEETDNTVSEEELKKEMIRQAMSELGKRSAAARRRRSSC